MSVATNGAIGQFFGWDGAGKVANNQYSEPIDDSEWLAAGGANPASNPYMRAASRLSPGQGFTEWQVVTPQDRRRHPIIGDIHDRYGIPHLCTYELLETRESRLFLVSLRSSRAGPIEAEERAVFHHICEAATVAARRVLKLGGEASNLLAGAFDAMSVAALVCDVFGRTIAMSQKAEALVRCGTVLRTQRNALHARTPRETAELERALLCAAHHQPGSPPDRHANVPLTNGLGQVVATAQAIPLPRDRCEIGLGAAAVLIIDERHRIEPTDIAGQFGLTGTEADIANLLRQRLRIAEIAERRGVSRETVRTQSKAVYLKLGVSGQHELIARFVGE